MRSISLLALGLAAMLSASCGFQPIYANSQGQDRPLSYIEIEQIDGRDGYFMMQELDRLLDPGSSTETKTHTMKVDLRMIKRAALVRLDEVAQRNEFILKVEFEIFDDKTGKLVFKDRFDVTTAADEPNEPFSAIAGDMAGEERVAQLAAERLRLRLLAASAKGSIP